MRTDGHGRVPGAGEQPRQAASADQRPGGPGQGGSDPDQQCRPVGHGASFDGPGFGRRAGGAPRVPQAIPSSEIGVPVWHSSRVRDIRSLITDAGRLKVDSKGNGAEKRKIVVVGGQMSGVEVAANMALQLSDAINAPGKEIMDWEGWEVVHVVQKPVWLMPLFLPKNPQVDSAEKGPKVC